MAVTVVTPPTEEPLTAAEAKAQTNLTHDDDNLLFVRLITTSRLWIEQTWNRALVTQTLRVKLDEFPCGRDPFYVPRPPLIAVSSISYVDVAGTTQTWAAANYQVDADGLPGRIVPAYNTVWPTARTGQINSVTFNYTAGFGATAASVPAGYKQAMCLLIAHWYRYRSAVLTGTISKELEFTLMALKWQLGMQGY